MLQKTDMIRHLLLMSMEKYIILIRIGLKQFEKNEAKKCIQHLTQGWNVKMCEWASGLYIDYIRIEPDWNVKFNLK